MCTFLPAQHLAFHSARLPALPVPLLPRCPPALHLPLQTLERSYLLRVNGKVVERPQHMLMRVAVGIHMENIDAGV